MNKKTHIERFVNSVYGAGVSSHTIAKTCDCTPSYARRVCDELFKQGRISYAIVPHQGNAKFKRVYLNCKHAHTKNLISGVNLYVMPAAVQLSFEEYEDFGIREDWQNE